MILESISQYLQLGGLFNPELMDHAKVRDMIIACRDRIEALEAELAKVTSTEYLTEAIQKVGMVDAEWQTRAEAAEADKARLSEALRTLLYCPDIADNDDKDEETHAAERVARAALSGSGSGWPVPDGWKLVPVEPTDEMLRAGQIAADDHRWKWCGYGLRKEGEGLDGMLFHVREAYRAMLPAAPQQGGE